MEVDDFVDKYKTSRPLVRVLLVIAMGILPALYIWMEEGDRIAMDLEDVTADESATRSRLLQAKRKVAQLPSLLAKLSEIELQLKRAKNVLPDEIEIDKILSVLGNLEAQFDVKVLKFTPGDEVAAANGLEYQELPIDLELIGGFSQIMQFYDSLVHLSNLTHLRSVELEKSDNPDDVEQLVISRSQLILFKGQ